MNNDGYTDFLCGDASNNVYIFWRDADGNITGSENVKDCEGENIVQGTRYSIPQLIDWNSDGLLDLLVGTAANSYYTAPHPLAGQDMPGLIWLYVNTGTAENYEFTFDKVLLSVSGDTLTAPAYSHFTMGDLDGDSLDDIITVGKAVDSLGYFCFWKNIGTRTNPLFADPELLRKDDGTIIDFVGSTWMFINDYNNDGIADLVYNSSRTEVGGASKLAGYLWISYGIKSTSSSELLKSSKNKNGKIRIKSFTKNKIEFSSPKSGIYSVKIISLNGKFVFEKEIFAKKGISYIDFSRSLIRSSVYIVKIKSADISIKKVQIFK